MKANIHYEVKAKLVLKKISDGEFEFAETNKEFYSDNPIKAREDALKFYHLYLSFFQNPKNWENKPYQEIRKEVEKYIDPKTSSKYTIDGEIFELSDSFGNGIGVFMVLDNPDDLMDESASKYCMIHGMGMLLEGSSSPESIMLHLEEEYKIYKKYNYDTGGYETSIAFCNSEEWLEGYHEDQPETITILKTPFDWSGMDKPYWWGEPDEEDEIHEQEPATYVKTWEEIIAGGENNQVEFKPALLYNHFSKKAGISIKGIIAKSICGFLNARGGFLFIGMNDDGTPQGLSHDYSLAEEKAPKDYFSLQFDDTLKQFLPESIPNISGKFITIEDTEIFVVIVFPSKRKPVFMKGQYGKEFWVRWTASTRQIVDVEEVANYCLEHWGNKT